MPYFSLADTLSGWSDAARLERGKAVGPEYNYWNDKENIVFKKKKLENNLQEFFFYLKTRAGFMDKIICRDPENVLNFCFSLPDC